MGATESHENSHSSIVDCVNVLMSTSVSISIYHLYQIKCCAESRQVESVAIGSTRLFLWLCGLCWGVPLIVEMIMLNTGSYGRVPDPNTMRYKVRQTC